MVFSELDNLKNKISTLNQEAKNYGKEISKYEKRESKLIFMIGNMEKVVSGEYSDVNDNITKIINAIDEALIGMETASTISTMARLNREKEITVDSNMSEAHRLLKRELSDTRENLKTCKEKRDRKIAERDSCKRDLDSKKRETENKMLQKYRNAEAKYKTAKKAYLHNPTSAQLKKDCDHARDKYFEAKSNYEDCKRWS